VWERDDAYPCIVRSGDLRVIECRDAIQWILQRCRKGGTWRDLGYFRNRDVLIERFGLAKAGPTLSSNSCQQEMEMLRSLPPVHVGGAL
jgi:hypothetical protein